MLTTIAALLVPLAINLRARAEAELKAQALVQAQTVASAIGDARVRDWQRIVTRAQRRATGGRVIVVDGSGILVADSAGRELLGQRYATDDRPELVAAVDGVSRSLVRRSETLGQDILATAVPIPPDRGAVRVTLPMDEVRRNAGRTLLGLVAIGLAGLAAGLLIAFIVAGTLSRPLQRVARTAERLGAGELGVRTGKVRGPQEIEEVAREFDEMASRLEATVRGQREFAANASHQLRTPLTGLRLRLESAAEDASPELRRELEAAQHEVDRLAAIVERLLVLAKRRESDAGRAVPLRPAADRAVERWSVRAREAGATLEARGDGGEALADPGDVDQILDSLIDNGISHARGPIVVEAGRMDGVSFVAVEDRGPGIPRAERGRVVERFYRGRGASAGGSGLGLAIVRELAERWGGSVEIGP
ncbi:MAG TPA: HAMP domain-containing sensor histidine kinase, partial [Actinomycetota bacterium]|nr:HAMP domain-containing sensor histidine kinase [Actinomycetota bacterium]